MYLKELTALPGPSGREDRVREYIMQTASAFCDEVRKDKLGNVIATRRGSDPNGPTIMAVAHMDEVGLLLTRIEDNGLLHFATIGGIDGRILLSQRVRIGEKGVPGVIGAMPIHLLKPEDIKKPVPIEELTIDIGVSSREDAEKLVQRGDWVVFEPGYVEFGDNLVKSRALDDRAGCSLLLEALQHQYAATLVGVFSVMEEIGGFGAQVAAHAVAPDAAVILEGTTCADIHDVPDHLRVTRVGKGPAISIMDRSAISNNALRRFLIGVAERNGIPWQNRAGAFGGTDAGPVSLSRAGVPVVNINVPCRYIHSPICTMSKTDYDNAGRLLQAFLGSAHEHLKEERK